ncbi:MAG TPA: hypothetical protein VET87_17735 [Rubrivivax sp.]|nr:hypothetical protein [Rubrivivax sp.]
MDAPIDITQIANSFSESSARCSDASAALLQAEMACSTGQSEAVSRALRRFVQKKSPQ